MEQKQLDEIEESFAGEEFIDDTGNNDIIIEQIRPKPKASKVKKAFKKIAGKKSMHIAEERKMVEEQKDVKHSESKHSAKSESKNIHSGEESKEKRVKEEPVMETAPSIDLWKENESQGSGKGLFEEASTWKAITGIMVILLLLSVFTQGFNFAKKNSPETVVLPLPDVEQKVLDFVNSNLLRPPFAATVVASQDANEVYKITLSVAGQQLDSYATKDGALFFPQGFDTSGAQAVATPPTPAANEEAVAAPTEPTEDTTTSEEGLANEGNEGGSNETIADAGTTEASTAEVATPPAAPAEEAVAPEAAVSFEISARKWLFNPAKITVKQGDKVSLTIIPQNLTFTFAIPDYSIGQEIAGITTIEFKADKVGRFEFVCSDCPQWGAPGILVVE